MVESTTPDIAKSLLVEAVKATVMDEIQWGMFPFQSEAYVPLGTVMLRFPPYWFRSTAIMTTTIFVIMARGMIHPI